MQLLRPSTRPKRSWTNCRTTFQFQLARSMPAAAGAACTAAFSSACCAGSRAGGTTALLEGQTRRTFLAEVFLPVADRVGIALQRLGHLGG